MKAIDIPVGHIARSVRGVPIVLNCTFKGRRISVFIDDQVYDSVETGWLNDEYEDMGLYIDWISR